METLQENIEINNLVLPRLPRWNQRELHSYTLAHRACAKSPSQLVSRGVALQRRHVAACNPEIGKGM